MNARFDLFRGSLDSPMWVEAALTLVAAKDRMIGIARKSPGRYFVFDSSTRVVMHSMDTTPSLKRMESPLVTSQVA
jgi:hypothetical protein